MNLRKSLLLLGAALMAPALQAGTLVFSPGSQSLLFGNQASLDIVVQGLGNGVTPALASFDITVLYNGSILQADSVAFSSRLGDPNASEAITFNQTLVSGVEYGVNLVNISLLDPTTLFALQTSGPGGFTLATLTFNTVGSGTSPLSFFISSAADETAAELGLTGGTGSIEVMSAGPVVPEPATYTLGGAGLLLVGLVRRFRSR